MVPMGSEAVTSGQVPSNSNISGNVLHGVDSIDSITDSMHGGLQIMRGIESEETGKIHT